MTDAVSDHEALVIGFGAIKARHTPPEKDPNKKYPYQLVHFNDLRPGLTSPYIVDGLIPLNGLVAVWGPPKSGKSFWTFDLVMHIALGWSYRGRCVEQGPVVYCAFEGAEGFHARAEAFRRTHEIKNIHPWDNGPWFYLLASGAKLVRDRKALIESIHGQTDDRPPTVVVLDTLNRSIDGSESKDQDMGAYLAAAEAICDAFDCVVIIVHHSGIDSSRPRGHTSLSGAANVQIAIRRDAARNVIAEVEAMKDGPEGAIFTSRLEVIEVGTDLAGKPITSCAIAPIENAATAKGPKLSGDAKLAFEVLQDLIAESGEAITSSHAPANTRGVSLSLWREYFYNAHTGDKQGTKKKAFQRAAGKLQTLHFIGVWADKVWLAGQRGHRE
jgi:AAA domain